MLQQALLKASSLLFPTECEICGAFLNSAENPGVCASCRGKIRRISDPFCGICGRPLRTGGGICAFCRVERFHFNRAFACAVYEGAMKELLHAYKFHRRRALGELFARMMFEFAAAHMTQEAFDFILPVPMDPEKWVTRGFNASEILSAALSKKLGVPHALFLKRRKSDSPQFQLAKNDRRENVKGCFWVEGGGRLAGKKLLLVDDILTTGQTVSECSRVLKKSGASRVTVFACARGA